LTSPLRWPAEPARHRTGSGEPQACPDRWSRHPDRAVDNPQRQVRRQRPRRDNRTGTSGVYCRFASNGQPRAWVARTRCNGKTITMSSWSESTVRKRQGNWRPRNAGSNLTKWFQTIGRTSQTPIRPVVVAGLLADSTSRCNGLA